MTHTLMLSSLLFAPLFQMSLVSSLQVELVWWHSPPYIYKNSTEHDYSIFTAFKRTSEYGCHVSSFSYGPKFQSYAEFINHVNKVDNETTKKDKLRLFLPAYQNSITNRKYLFGEIGLVKSPGMTLVANRILKSRLYTLAVKGFENAKAFLVIMVLFMIDFGIVIWICERHLHGRSGDFRPGFVTGVWDAVWWAAVTMTTVGYGDKTPKSNLGRFIGMLWLFMSAALMAGFTALMTSSLDANPEFASQKVVVLNDSVQSFYVNNKRGTKIVVNSYEDALQKAVSLRVVGALLDTNVVAHFQDGLFEGGLGIQQSIDEEQNVTILYLQSELKQITGAKAYIDCLDRTLLKHADALRPVLKAERIATIYEVLTGEGMSFNIFFYFYISTGALIFLGVLVELWRVYRKANKVACAETRSAAVKPCVQSKESEQLTLVLDELKSIKTALKDLEAGNVRLKTTAF